MGVRGDRTSLSSTWLRWEVFKVWLSFGILASLACNERTASQSGGSPRSDMRGSVSREAVRDIGRIVRRGIIRKMVILAGKFQCCRAAKKMKESMEHNEETLR